MINTSNLTKVFGTTTEVMEYWSNGMMAAAQGPHHSTTPTLQYSSL